MYMDSGRQVDLLRIDQKVKDPNSPVAMVRGYLRTKDKIIDQMRDKKLAEMRERLMKASRANDQWEMWKLTCLIQDYRKEERAEYWR